MEKAKNIVATFLKVDPSEISESTLIDNSAIPGSVLIHRMYSTLSAEGFHVVDQKGIRTYGDLLNFLNGNSTNHPSPQNEEIEKPKSKKITKTISNTSSELEVGIDIEDIFNMPVADDFRENRFYTDNFSKKEISHCILQADPRASFAGKFAAKEAIIKADNSYKSTPFNQIEILNDDGKPFFNEFSISISHTTNQAVAVAIKGEVNIVTNSTENNSIAEDEIKAIIEKTVKIPEQQKSSNKLNYLSILLSIVAIGLVLFYK
jgi:phosphopantetheine--protein transferase-like protein